MAIVQTPEQPTYIAGPILLVPPFIPPAPEAALAARIDYNVQFLYEVFANLFRLERAITCLIEIAEKQGVDLENFPYLVSNTTQNILSQIQPLLTRQPDDSIKSLEEFYAENSKDIDQSSRESAMAAQSILSLLESNTADIQEMRADISKLQEDVSFILENIPGEIQTRINTAIDELKTELTVKFS